MSESILKQIKNEAEKAKREAVKGKLKNLYKDYNDAVEVVKGIEQKIIELVKEVGETPEDVKSILGELE